MLERAALAQRGEGSGWREDLVGLGKEWKPGCNLERGEDSEGTDLSRLRTKRREVVRTEGC